MPPFLHGWRRKIGVFTLVIACASCCLWVRSLFVIDLIDFELWGTRNRIAIMEGCMGWDQSSPYPYVGEASTWGSMPRDKTSIFDLLTDVTWQLRGFGFARGQLPAYGDIVITVTVVPCSWCVVPLSLLSAWLLLSTPQPFSKGKCSETMTDLSL